MKIGLVSDTHGDVASFERLLAGPFRDVDLIVHSGDVLNHGPGNPLPPGYNPAGLKDLLNGLGMPLFIAQGNCDSEVDRMLLDMPFGAPYLFLWLEGFPLLVHHGHLLTREETQRIIPPRRPSLTVSGHSHVFGIKREDGVLYVNPGSPSIPKGKKIPTAAILEIEKGSARVGIVDLRDFSEIDSAALP